jgi:hypothetical protein
MDTLEWMRKTHKCCSCEKPLSEDPDAILNLVQTDYKATWKYPQFGNVLLGTSNIAGAIVCNACRQTKNPIKFVLEYQGDTVIYHPIETLKLTDRLAKKSTQVK